MIHVLDGMELDFARFHHTTQNNVQFKTYGLLISGIFHLMFSDLIWPWVTETMDWVEAGTVVLLSVHDGHRCVF